MPTANLNSATISSIHTTVGPILRRIDEEIENFGGNASQIARIKKVIGLNERRVVDSTLTALDLCHDAVSRLPNIEGVDALIFVTQTPDHFQPCNAAILHGRLGLPIQCAALDLSLGCSGWVYGLYIASLMIESGGCNKVLLAAGDTMSRCVHPQDRSVASLFGDAGTATLVERSPDSNPSWFSLHTDGSGWKSIYQPAGGFRQPKSAATEIVEVDADGNSRSAENLFMNGAEVFNFSIKREPAAVQEILNYAGMSVDNIAAVVFHQANRYIISNIARRLKIPAHKTPCGTVEKYGNQSSASIPATICEELFATVTGPKQSMIFSGFGVGLSWATALTSIGNLQHCGLSVYEL